METDTTSQQTPEIAVTTQPYALTPNVYFKISVRNMFWMIWWCFLFIFLFDLLCLWNIYAAHVSSEPIGGYVNSLFFTSFMGVFLLVWLLGVCFWRSYRTKAARLFFQQRQLTISRDQITAFQADEGNLWKYKRDQFYGIEILGSCYLFWVAPQMFVYVPKSAFASEQDRMTLENEILPAYPKRKRRLWPGLLIGVGCLAFVLLVASL